MAESTLTRNRWTITRKAAVVLELLRGGETVEVARRHEISQAQLFAGRDRFLEGGQAAQRSSSMDRDEGLAGQPGGIQTNGDQRDDG